MFSNDRNLLPALVPASSSNNNSNTASTSSSRNTSTIRSRNRRQTSFNNDGQDKDTLDEAGGGRVDIGIPRRQSSLSLPSSPNTSRSLGTTPPSPLLSRQPSPLPMKRPTRAPDSFNGNGGSQLKLDPTPLGGLSLAGSSQLNLTETSRAAMDILDASWSSLQGLASSVLGSDVKSVRDTDSKTTKAKQKPTTRPTTSRTASWGPKASASLKVGTGSYEERQAYLQAKKRETLLLADADEASDLTSGHKRRVSADLPDHSAVDPDRDEGALVYIHHVGPNDTISGLTIRYGCQAAMFRRANGFWPSDSVQSRRTVLLPVAFCSVKGRPIRPAPTTDILGDISADSPEDPSSSSISPTEAPPSVETLSNATKSENSNEKEKSWKHESWVDIEGFTKPVEIGRVPLKTLGFFPRTRRKSLQQEDSSRSYISGWDQSGFLSSSGATPDRQSSLSLDPTDTNHSQRRRSSLHLADRGVGTLDDASNPGPNQDKLNRFVRQHIPGLAPRAASQQQHRSSFESGSSSTTNASTSFDNLGGMMEGWMRKVAQRAKSNINEWQQQGQQQQQQQAVGIGRQAPGLDGDLIELDSGLEAARKGSNASSTSLRTAAQQNTNTSRRPALLRDVSSSASLRGQLTATSRTRSDFGVGLKDD